MRETRLPEGAARDSLSTDAYTAAARRTTRTIRRAARGSVSDGALGEIYAPERPAAGFFPSWKRTLDSDERINALRTEKIDVNDVFKPLGRESADGLGVFSPSLGQIRAGGAGAPQGIRPAGSLKGNGGGEMQASGKIATGSSGNDRQSATSPTGPQCGEDDLAARYRDFKFDHLYSQEAYHAVKKVASDIEKAAEKFGVHREAIAGAIWDEYSTYTNRLVKRLGDEAQHRWASWMMSLDSVREERMNGNTAPLSASRQDIGPGNVNVRTGLALFEKYVVQDKQDNPIKEYLHQFVDPAAPDAEKWEAYKKHMMLTFQGTAYLAAAEMAGGRKELEPYMEGLCDEEKAAVLMTWYKQGPKYLERYLENVRAGKTSGPIQPGEGVGIIKERRKIAAMWDVG